MPEQDEDKINHIEEISKKLYSRNENLLRKKKGNELPEMHYGIPREWNEEKFTSTPMKIKLPHTFFKKFFFFSAAFFAVALIFTFVKFYGGSNTISPQNIDITVLGNAFAAGGEELPLQVVIENKNNVSLQLADLLVEYPKGSSGETTGDFVRIRKSLGTIGAGGVANEAIKVTLFGEQGTTKDIKVSLEYRVESSNAIFVKDAIHTVNISSSPILLSIEAPQSVTSNQEMTLNVKVTSRIQQVSKGILLKVQYPSGFKFESATPGPLVGEDTWDLGDLALDAVKSISIKGTLLGQDGEERSFKAYVGEGDPKDLSTIGTIYNSLLQTVSITRPFIEARLLINNLDQEEFAAGSGSPISAEIHWTNNLPTRVDDMQIKARITGNALNKSSIKALSGFYNSTDDTITWDRNTEGDLSSVDPGATGVLTFTFTPTALSSGSGSFVAEPTVDIGVSISGKQPASGNILSEINNSESKKIKINSDLQIVSKALYYSGPFQNSGPIPPKAEQKTTYTITWTVMNTANSVSGAEVKATLPFYVKYAGVVSPPGENISFNQTTREVLWSLGQVAASTGFGGDAREVSFQVELTPSVSQVGSAPQLLSETVLTGVDNFTNSNLKSTRNSLNTRLSNDTTFKSGDESVIE